MQQNLPKMLRLLFYIQDSQTTIKSSALIWWEKQLFLSVQKSLIVIKDKLHQEKSQRFDMLNLVFQSINEDYTLRSGQSRVSADTLQISPNCWQSGLPTV